MYLSLCNELSAQAGAKKKGDRDGRPNQTPTEEIKNLCQAAFCIGIAAMIFSTGILTTSKRPAGRLPKLCTASLIW